MLSRPVALFIAAAFSWRAVFWASAILIVVIWLALARSMPRYQPRSGLSYGQLLLSMADVLKQTPVLRWRSAYQCLMFAAFTMYWTTVPLLLEQQFHFSKNAIGLFALAGAGGALAAPLAGRLADRGLTQRLTAIGIVLMGGCFFATRWFDTPGSLVPLVLATILLDAATQLTHITSQRLVLSEAEHLRGRMNGLYVTIVFIGGALGSIAGTLTYDLGGWHATAALGGLIGLAMLSLFLTQLGLEKRNQL
jgi:predicted MFS family arabinose efflux permease